LIKLDLDKKNNLHILYVGSHSDDIEIGCGGTLLKWLEEGKIKQVDWVIFSADEIRKKEAEKSAKMFTHNRCELNLFINNFRDSFLPYIGAEVKDYFLSIKTDINPDIIFTHYRKDLHQDHRFISDLTHNLFRDHLILEYEIPKYDSDLGNPNVFVQLDENIIENKLANIQACFQSQKENHWFSKKKLSALNILRGIESNNLNTYTEAFFCNKMIL